MRKVIGPRLASVFITPVRAALEASDYDTASAENRQLAGEGISRQAFALQPTILDVDRWVRHAPGRVIEVRPEVSFAQLASEPLRLSTSTWPGASQRQQLLATAGILLAEDLGVAGEKAAIDDVLDAAVAAWSARRVAHCQARPAPGPPETFSGGLPCAIWT